MLAASRPFGLIVFGASGHLAKNKLYPALYVLALKKRLPADYAVIGFSRTDMDDDAFRAMVAESVRTDMIEVNEATLKEFLTHVHYHRGQYDETDAYRSLLGRMQELEKRWAGRPVRLAYLSIPPAVFGDVLKNLCAGGVHDRATSDFRCIVEKPVGHDLKSFEEVRGQLTGCFTEEEVYLLDHYLGKEAVRNIYYLRFANPILERMLKNTLIHHVEITASEAGGLEGRAGYFEHTGTFRDMVQSHLLMIASLLTMRLHADEAFRDGRRNALEQFYLPPAADMDDVVLQGQYAAGTVGKEHVPGYREESDIDPASRTNTYVALKLMTRISRWEGVPFSLRTGKRLRRKETRISIQFQVPHPVGKGATPNRLDIILQGEAGMRMHLQTKVGGTDPQFRPLVLEDPLVCVGDCLPEHGLLLLEAILGKQQWYLTFEEIRAAWRLTDPLQAHLLRPDTALHLYQAGTAGPAEADAWIAKHGLAWLN